MSNEPDNILTADEALNDAPLGTTEYVNVYEEGMHNYGDDPHEFMTISEKHRKFTPTSLECQF